MIKIDLEKAFDKLEWSFVRFSLKYLHFPNKLIDIIMSCIFTTSTSILINGSRTDYFTPFGGIRQGDPLSPYLFIICMEMLSRLINHEIACCRWDPIKISAKGPFISHLFLADDLVLMMDANQKNYNSLVDTLNKFCNISGQTINFNKSRILFSNNTPQDIKNHISESLAMKQATNFGKYLGFPMINHRITSKYFQFIIDGLNNRLQGWKTNFFNMRGRTTLIKTTLATILNHIMQIYSLPKITTNKIDAIQRSFL